MRAEKGNRTQNNMLRALVGANLMIAAWGQSAAPAFEVATIKPSADLMVWSGFLLPGGGRLVGDGNLCLRCFEASHVTVKAMVAFAYDVRDFYISGGPGWAGGDRFDIVARTETSATPAQIRVMMQTLLKERFQLALRHESRTVTVYDLVVNKGAPKLKESSRKDGLSGIRFLGRGNVEGMGTAVSGLAGYLQTLLGNVVVDKTGLTGNYDFKLTWAPDEAQAGKPGAQGVPATNGAEESGPSIFTALQEQLGLKLEATKGPVETMVIERVEKPSEN
jgi:uncharacterized protein (TIGR03435 family)